MPKAKGRELDPSLVRVIESIPPAKVVDLLASILRRRELRQMEKRWRVLVAVLKNLSLAVGDRKTQKKLAKELNVGAALVSDTVVLLENGDLRKFLDKHVS